MNNKITATGLILTFLIAFYGDLLAGRPDSLCTHRIEWGDSGEMLPWYKPKIEGVAYDEVIRLASVFIKNTVPNEPKTGLPLYYLFCEFRGPEYDKDFYKGTTGRTTLPHNPSCVFAGFTESLAVKYRIYSGDNSYLEIVRGCLDHMLEHGTTPSDWEWANCPYSSSFPGNPGYKGTGYWELGRGDGEYVIEPDKVGEMGYAYLQFYEITEEDVYLKAALDCADALAKNIKPGSYGESPWPFRVQARTAYVTEKYCSNVLPAVKLFDELERIKGVVDIDEDKIDKYKQARDKAWEWLFSKEGPMKTYVWKGYFEDVPSDENNENRVQVTPLEVARYIIEHPEYDLYYKQDVEALIKWCDGVFGTEAAEGYNAQCEQLWCFRPMGSHTARYASVCAMWYALDGGNEWYKNEAFENFNWATYCTSKLGFVSVGTGWAGAWFSDGYGDYIKHFVDGMAAIPEWAPAGEDHLLKSTSVVQNISYGEDKINYSTFLSESTEILRLKSLPREVTVDSKIIKRSKNPDAKEGWEWEELKEGGILRIKHLNGRDISIER